ncbi:MAG: DNA mismatch repair protein MutS [Rhodobacteraceae bacterium]|nr:DNA mismatch repair protein MutS [Paracoccaceae bacterium]
MMVQFLGIKAEYPDALLFYRMGDFYEMFFEDAILASEALDIALTKRGKHLGEDIAMCGVPYHAAEGYLLNLIRKGFRVAVAEQMENPAEAKKRGAKSVVKREVVRLVTPGTLTEDALLEARRHNYLAAYTQIRDTGALAWADISTGALHVVTCPPAELAPTLARLMPSEMLVTEATAAQWQDMADETKSALTPMPGPAFDSASGEKRLCALFGTASLESFGAFTRAEISAMAALTEYLQITQKGNKPLLRPPVREEAGATVQIDAATRRSLELTHAVVGGRAGSLLHDIDQTVTAAGARLLEQRISAPSRKLDLILARQQAIATLAEDTDHRLKLRDNLRGVHDIARALSRLALDRAGPRDLAALRDTIARADAICTDTPQSELLSELRETVANLGELSELLEQALVAEPPLLARDGGFIALGYDDELDKAKTLRDEGRAVIANMQAEYAEATGIPSLKIKHNNVLGYFIETTIVHAEKMLAPPLSETFIRRQATANHIRFTTIELGRTETDILNAGGHALALEKSHFAVLRQAVLDTAGPAGMLASNLAELDLTAALADIAMARDWCRPSLDNSREFVITGGRHPVVETALRRSGAAFIANDCNLSDDAIWLLTGPNMAGKSTFLRQNALIAVLAQIGSFVPAHATKIGLVSQIFSRVGASDDLARGRSTFMVEMVETAAILNQADDKALVILDEIGRGTATYDGLSIAWAVLEHLHGNNRCRAVFATHYHEMSALAASLDGVGNATVSVREWENEVIFLHEVKRGTADRSYGVQVARLAGLPASVVARAKLVLEKLEKSEREGGRARDALMDDLPLFAAMPTAPPPEAAARSEAEALLRATLPDELSPRDALALIYELKALLKAKL